MGRIFIEGRKELYLRGQDIVDGLAVILRLEWSSASDYFVEKDSCSPNINFFIVAAPCKHLRCSVVECPSNSKHVEFGSSPAMFSANTKINKFKFGCNWVVKNVFKLNISMYNCTLV